MSAVPLSLLTRPQLSLLVLRSLADSLDLFILFLGSFFLFKKAYTDAEMKHTPPTLEELQQERIKRERRARQDLDGYQLLRRGSGIAWDPAFEGKFTKWAWEGKNGRGTGVGGGQSEFAKE